MDKNIENRVINYMIETFNKEELQPNEACGVMLSAVLRIISAMAPLIGRKPKDFILEVLYSTIKQVEEHQWEERNCLR